MSSVYIRIRHNDDLVIAEFEMSKSLPYPSENPHPNALIIVLISAFARILSILAFSTFRIFPLIGRIA